MCLGHELHGHPYSMYLVAAAFCCLLVSGGICGRRLIFSKKAREVLHAVASMFGCEGAIVLLLDGCGVQNCCGLVVAA